MGNAKKMNEETKQSESAVVSVEQGSSVYNFPHEILLIIIANLNHRSNSGKSRKLVGKKITLAHLISSLL